MRLSPALASLLLAAAAAACAGVPQPAPAGAPGPPVEWRSLVGCYRADDWRFAFDSVPFLAVHSIEDSSRLARSTNDWWGRGYDTYWRMTAPDSVKLVWDAGLHGGHHQFAVRGDTLVGLIHAFSDTPPYRDRPRRVTAVREPCADDVRLFPARPDSAREALLFGYFAALPPSSRMEADPWRAVAPLHAWLDAHPQALRDFYFRIHARTMFDRASSFDVRAHARELVGTYRLEVERTGGPTHVFHGRTEIQPQYALRPGDTTIIARDQPSGYRLRFTMSADSSSLPRSGPGRRHRDAYGGNTAANSRIDVRLPATMDADGTRRLRGHVMLVNFGYFFHASDPELWNWAHEWFRRDYDFDGPNLYAEFVVTPEGRVTFTQREVYAPDQVVTLRGERISGGAWQCAREEENC
jgi:hypothetical protein